MGPYPAARKEIVDLLDTMRNNAIACKTTSQHACMHGQHWTVRASLSIAVEGGAKAAKGKAAHANSDEESILSGATTGEECVCRYNERAPPKCGKARWICPRTNSSKKDKSKGEKKPGKPGKVRGSGSPRGTSEFIYVCMLSNFMRLLRAMEARCPCGR